MDGRTYSFAPDGAGATFGTARPTSELVGYGRLSLRDKIRAQSVEIGVDVVILLISAVSILRTATGPSAAKLAKPDRAWYRLLSWVFSVDGTARASRDGLPPAMGKRGGLGRANAWWPSNWLPGGGILPVPEFWR